MYQEKKPKKHPVFYMTILRACACLSRSELNDHLATTISRHRDFGINRFLFCFSPAKTDLEQTQSRLQCHIIQNNLFHRSQNGFFVKFAITPRHSSLSKDNFSSAIEKRNRKQVSAQNSIIRRYVPLLFWMLMYTKTLPRLSYLIPFIKKQKLPRSRNRIRDMLASGQTKRKKRR